MGGLGGAVVATLSKYGPPQMTARVTRTSVVPLSQIMSESQAAQTTDPDLFWATLTATFDHAEPTSFSLR